MKAFVETYLTRELTTCERTLWQVTKPFHICLQEKSKVANPFKHGAQNIIIIIIIIISFMQLGHLLPRSSLTYPEVSWKVYHDSFCQLEKSVSLSWVIYFETFYLHVVSSFSWYSSNLFKLVLFLTHLQFVHLFCNLSKCILLFFSCISSLLLLIITIIIMSLSVRCLDTRLPSNGTVVECQGHGW